MNNVLKSKFIPDRVILCFVFLCLHMVNNISVQYKCSFQKESIVCEWRIGIRKGSGDVVLLFPSRGAVV